MRKLFIGNESLLVKSSFIHNYKRYCLYRILKTKWFFVVTISSVYIQTIDKLAHSNFIITGVFFPATFRQTCCRWFTWLEITWQKATKELKCEKRMEKNSLTHPWRHSPTWNTALIQLTSTHTQWKHVHSKSTVTQMYFEYAAWLLFHFL